MAKARASGKTQAAPVGAAWFKGDCYGEAQSWVLTTRTEQGE